MRNVLNFLASLRVAELTKIFDDENLPLTHGVIWNEFGRNYRCFRQKGTEVSIFQLLECPTDDEQMTGLLQHRSQHVVARYSSH